MEQEYREHYRDLFERHWWWRARSDFIMETLERLWPAGKRPAILDVGCGEGLFFERLSRLGDVEGIEIPEAVPASSPWRDRIYTCPFDESFQPGKQYSLILMLDVLEHLSDPRAAVRNVHRLLEDGGIFVATVPAFRALWTSHDVINQHFERYTRSSLRAVMASTGFHLRELRYFFHWVFLAKILVRLREGVFGAKPGVPGIPSPGINQCLYAVSRLEQRGARGFPGLAGGSLLMVAVKQENLAPRHS